MSYQHGSNGIKGYKNFVQAINNNDYQTAYKEMLNSQWAKIDSPKRAQKLADTLLKVTGTTKPVEPIKLKADVNNKTEPVVNTPSVISKTIDNIKESVSSASTAVENKAEDITEWTKRAMVKTGIIEPYGTEKIKIQKQVPKKVITNKVNEDGSEYIENNFTLLGDVPSVTNSKEDKYFSFYNKFDRTKGFNYIPIKNVGASNGNTTYKNTKGVAHFILDSDVTTDYQKEEAVKFIEKQLRSENIEPGSTVKDQFIPTYEKLKNGQVNVKYKKISELNKKDKIMSPLRQYNYTDLNWKGQTKSLGFAESVKSIPTVTGDPTHIIFSPAKGGKDGYGKFGGVSVVFLSSTKNIAIDFAGSVNQIKAQADKIIKEENIKPEDLIIAYHDLGSFSAKPKGRKNNTLNFSQWSGFNTKPYTGGGLAFPSN